MFRGPQTLARPLAWATFCLAPGLLGWTAPGLAPRREPMPGGTPSTATRVAVFWEAGFPAVEVAAPDRSELGLALDGFDVAYVPTDRLTADLTVSRYDVLLMPYGSAFPKEAWPAILGFLRGGGNLVNLGGVPFRMPVVREHDLWKPEGRATAYHRRLGIVCADLVDARRIARYEAAPMTTASDRIPDGFGVSVSESGLFVTDVRLAETRDFPDEDGTGGQRDARAQPLVHAIDHDGLPVAAPFLRIDRLLGEFAGGRWVLAAFDGTITPAVVRAMVTQAASGAVELAARPVFAGFRTDEAPSMELRLSRPKGSLETLVAGPCQIEVLHSSGRVTAKTAVRLEGSGSLATATVRIPSPPRGMATGLYEVRASAQLNRPGGQDAGTSVIATTGFWIYEPAMLAGGQPLTLTADYFERDGRPYPVTGTTYMGSDVHRKFLLEPNPALWDRDFAAMKQAGVNMVRTGIWTGWKQYMLDVGTLSETALRSLDVFLLTARRHDIPVIFTLFAFLPEAWGGVNPYLDPRSVQAQESFAGTLARRYRLADDLVWDLINEPSFSTAAHLWFTRPSHDEHEQAAWRQWLRDRYPAPTDEAHEARLQAIWHLTPGDSLALPEVEDFEDGHLVGVRQPLKVLDYRLFAQEMFGRWVRRMRAALRSGGNPRQLVTVGQDEGGITERPNPLFHGDDVDFTSVHTWWNNGDLLWDSVMTKRPDRPGLVEETGTMVYERPRAEAWRTDEANRDLFERKLATAIGAGGAGFIQWIWSTNVYMPSDNEAGIGFFRADLTARRSLVPFVDISRFVQTHAARFRGRRPEDVVMVVPHSQMYSVRGLATEATRRAIRALSHELGTPARVVSEYALDRFLGAPKLIVFPAPRVCSQPAWDGLMAAVEQGATLLVSGAIDADEHWRPADRSTRLGTTAGLLPVPPEFALSLEGTEHRLRFPGAKLERVEFASTGSNAVITASLGRGRVIWVPVPVELAEPLEATVAVYRHALQAAGVTPLFELERPAPGVLVLPSVFADSVLFALVSETNVERIVRIVPAGAGTSIEARVPGGRALLILADRVTGRVIGRTEPR